MSFLKLALRLIILFVVIIVVFIYVGSLSSKGPISDSTIHLFQTAEADPFYIGPTNTPVASFPPTATPR